MYSHNAGMAKFCWRGTQVPHMGLLTLTGVVYIVQLLKWDSIFTLFYGAFQVPGFHSRLSVWMVVSDLH